MQTRTRPFATVCALVLGVGLCVGLSEASAQTNTSTEHYVREIAKARRIAPAADVLGEHVNPQTGSISFTQTDISLTGNGPSIEITRTYDAQSSVTAYHYPWYREFASWKLEIPRITTIDYRGNGVGAPTGAYIPDGDWDITGPNPMARCSGYTQASNIWGMQLEAPGSGAQEILIRSPENTVAPVFQLNGSPVTFNLVTKEGWAIACLPNGVKNGKPGDAFFALAPDGTRYWFDWMTFDYVGLWSLIPLPYNTPFRLLEASLLVTRVEDRFGNYVRYQYEGDRLVKIIANDGREVNLEWTGDMRTDPDYTPRYFIKNIVVQPGSPLAKTWGYTYTGKALSGVTLPDSSKWAFSLTNLGFPTIDLNNPSSVWTPDYTLRPPATIVTPSGMTATYRMFIGPIGRNGTAAAAFGDSARYAAAKLGTKQYTGPGVNSSWTYSYVTQYPFNTSVPLAEMRINRPDGTVEAVTVDNVAGSGTEGKVVKRQILANGGTTALRTDSYAYAQNLGPYPAKMGHSNSAVRRQQKESLWPIRQVTITQDGVTFNQTVNTYDVHARALSITRASTMPHGLTAQDTQTYHDDLSLWVLGQVKTSSRNGIQVSRTDYGWMSLPWKTYSFGKLRQTFSYETSILGQVGTIKTTADGGGNASTFSSWKRGIPQLIRHPATPEAPTGATQSAIVNDLGWITSTTDENGYATGYGYDPMGRLASIVYPTGDNVTWNATTQVFQQITSPEYGIPAGHWRQTVSTGSGRKVIYFDALWRPLIVREYDTANESGTQRFRRFAYDYEGRATFVSYPATAYNVGTGTWNEYDGLGRQTSVSKDSELGLLTTLTTYLSGFRSQTTNPKGHQTITSYLAWDEPITEFPVLISHPAGAYTHISRDIFGKPTQLRRSNSSSPTGGTAGVNRIYSYNSQQELCRSVEPETGATLMGYDAAGNLSWSASGLPAGTACHGTGNSTTINPRKVTRSYDGRNRIASLAFANGIGNQAWTYTPDGLPVTIVTNNTSGGMLVTNAYSYNRRRLPTGESVKRGTAAAWGIGYGYDANGHNASLVYPSSLSVAYAPNALGQPTQVGTYATGVSYFPNGSVKQFTYGNGMIHTLTQNARGLPARITDCAASGTCAASSRRLDLQYVYDKHGNVSNIADNVSGGRQARGMSYDALDRLIQTTSMSTVFGTASYGYDVLDNLTTVHVSGGSQSRNHTYSYDAATQRLSQIKNTVGGVVVANLSYDVQGNLIGKGAQTYQFDLGNRLRSVPGRETGYEYDGHGRRVYAMTVGSGQIASQYGSKGQLMYQENNKQARRIDYVYLGSRLLVQRERPLSGSAVTVKYQHVDVLGTPLVVTDSAKGTVTTSEYEPYGQLVNKPVFDGPGYTGHVHDAASGLTYMQQRYFEPLSGVFLSVDPVTAHGSPVSQFHRYRYANSNPYRFKDPDGRRCTTLDGTPECTFDEFRDKKGGSVSREQAMSGGSRLAKLLGMDRGSRILRAEAAMTAKYSDAKNLAAAGGGVTIKGDQSLGIPDQNISGADIVARMENMRTIANEGSKPGNSRSEASVQGNATGAPSGGPINFWKDGAVDSNSTAKTFGHEILHTIYSGVGLPNRGWANPDFNLQHQTPFDEASDAIH